ncbi:MAG: MoaD/ThiS family protein [Chloroflexi bacterium]|nr:MoaD/ThiS family protein [Chloroflexota bacterium]
MQVQVKLFASLTQYMPGLRPGSPFEVGLPDGATLADLVRQLDLPQAEVKVIFVNARAQPLSYVLNPGDEVGLFPPVGGG